MVDFKFNLNLFNRGCFIINFDDSIPTSNSYL